MSTKARAVDRDFVMQVGGHVLATQLAGLRDPSAEGDSHLDRLADISVRAAVALDAAIPRAEERMAAEAKAEDDAKAAAEKAAKDAEAEARTAAKLAADQAEKDATRAAADKAASLKK